MKKNQIFILFGQSNAVGHNIPMQNDDKILAPLKNVFGLSRKLNQSFDINDLKWQGYTSCDMNLGEEQDHTYSLANCLATLWQKEIDGGRGLPDLYIVHIAVGAEGVTQKHLSNGLNKKYMWNPTYNRTLKSGKLGEVDISLYPFALHILSLIDDSFKQMGKEYEIMNLYWRGGENDIETPVQELKDVLKRTYEEMFSGFYNALKRKIPITLNKLLSRKFVQMKDASGEWLKSLDYINSVFYELEKENKQVKVFDCSLAPFYDKDKSTDGLFIEDLVHYSPKTNWWVANEILNGFLDIK